MCRGEPLEGQFAAPAGPMLGQGSFKIGWNRNPSQARQSPATAQISQPRRNASRAATVLSTYANEVSLNSRFFFCSIMGDTCVKVDI